MASFNSVTLLGNLTRDVDLKYLASGLAVCDFGLAVNDRVKKGDQYVDEPTFCDVTMFGKTAETASKYLAKGSQTLVSGRLKYEQWEKDGQKRSKLKVIGERLQLLGKPAEKTDDEYSQAPAPEADVW